jgi:phage terminase large subunit
VAELSQATVSETAAGKLQIDKVGEGERSPNLADALVMCYAPRRMPLNVSDEVANGDNGERIFYSYRYF